MDKNFLKYDATTRVFAFSAEVMTRWLLSRHAHKHDLLATDPEF